MFLRNVFPFDWLQPLLARESSGYDRSPSPDDIFASGVSSPSWPPCRCEEYSFRVADLESHLSLMKRQVQVALDKASSSHGLVKQVSDLEDKVSGLVARITHFEECESFLLGIVESVCEMLLCKSSGSFFSLFSLWLPSCWFLLASQVPASILLANHVELLSRLLLFKVLLKELKAYGPIPTVVMPSCFFRIMRSTLAKLLMVVVRPWQLCLSCCLVILCRGILGSYLKLSGRASESTSL
jgi:hypothetical protein